MKEAKKAPEENIAKAMETLAWLIASKNVIQCNAIKTPAPENCKNVFLSIFKLSLISFTYKNIKTPAIAILYHTKANEPMVISSPKIAVNPAIKTKKCK